MRDSSNNDVICLGLKRLSPMVDHRPDLGGQHARRLAPDQDHPGRSANRKRGPAREDDDAAGERKRSGVRLIGAPFWTDDEEKRYRAVLLRQTECEIDNIVTCEHVGTDGVVVQRYLTCRSGLIRYISEKRRPGFKASINCHIHWFCDDNDAGEPNELFLKHGVCGEVDIRLITKTGSAMVGQASDTGQFVKHVYQKSYSAWRDVIRLEGGQPACDACLSRPNTKSLELHVNDCVLLDESVVRLANRGAGMLTSSTISPLVWRVALIIATHRARYRVQLFDRPRLGTGGTAEVASEKRLILTSTEINIAAEQVLDRAFVVKDLAGTACLPPGRSFFCDRRTDSVGSVVNLSRPTPVCERCYAAARHQEALYDRFRQSTTLPAIDYYSGGGGGMIGASDFFKHRFAVEKEEHACRTLLRNFSDTTVICQPVAEASEHAQVAQGRRIRYTGQISVPSLPKTGSMCLALAGPPCQGHTGANHHNKVLDPRNDEVFVTIKEIERLRPDIFILENVPGMKMDKDEVNMEDTTNYALAAVRRLRRIGYQCRVTVLDARSFGSPQNRKRLFIVCARQGIPLPSNPEPTHANPELTVNSFATGRAEPRLFYVGTKGTQGSGPYPPVTVRDAISDMPPFEYELGQGGRGVVHFAADGLPRDRVGFTKPIPYPRPAGNDYQARLRGIGKRLDIIAKASVMVGEKSNADVPGKDRRINPDRGATTLLTDSGPGGMYTGAIHWDQGRTLTVAERKRLQGVPDSYHLSGTVHEKDRMLGNMINVDMSRALHGHIHREVFFPIWLEMGQPVGYDFFKRWRERSPV